METQAARRRGHMVGASAVGTHVGAARGTRGAGHPPCTPPGEWRWCPSLLRCALHPATITRSRATVAARCGRRRPGAVVRGACSLASVGAHTSLPRSRGGARVRPPRARQCQCPCRRALCVRAYVSSQRTVHFSTYVPAAWTAGRVAVGSASLAGQRSTASDRITG